MLSSVIHRCVVDSRIMQVLGDCFVVMNVLDYTIKIAGAICVRQEDMVSCQAIRRKCNKHMDI